MVDFLRRSWAVVDLDCIDHNIRSIKEKLKPGCMIMGVVKADAYGHGDKYIADELVRLGVNWFAVSNLTEAMSLRNQGIYHPILILGTTPPNKAKTLCEYNITQAVFSLEYAKKLQQQAQRAGGRIGQEAGGRGGGGAARLERVRQPSSRVTERRGASDRPAPKVGGQAGAQRCPFGPFVLAWELSDMTAERRGRALRECTVVLDEAHRDSDAERVRGLCRAARAVVCRNPGQIDLARDAGVPWGAAAPISVWNAATVRWLARLGAQFVWAPAELASERVDELEALAAGILPVFPPEPLAATRMVMEHCVLTAEGPCGGECASCPRRLASVRGERLLVERAGSPDDPASSCRVYVDVLGRTRLLQTVDSIENRAPMNPDSRVN